MFLRARELRRQWVPVRPRWQQLAATVGLDFSEEFVACTARAILEKVRTQHSGDGGSPLRAANSLRRMFANVEFIEADFRRR